MGQPLPVVVIYCILGRIVLFNETMKSGAKQVYYRYLTGIRSCRKFFQGNTCILVEMLKNLVIRL